MNPKITVLSRSNFQKLVDSLSDRQIEASAFIAINDPYRPDGNDLVQSTSDPIMGSTVNVLNLWCDDVEEQVNDMFELFNEQMAQDIVRFVLRNSDKKAWFIHCTFGKCRSGAIGEVLSDFFSIPYAQFKRENPQVQPNVLVKRLLTKAFQDEIEKPTNPPLNSNVPIENKELWNVCLNANKDPELFQSYLQIQRGIFFFFLKVQALKQQATEIAKKINAL